MKNKELVSIPAERIVSQIYIIRGKKVMLDRDLAELYDVETKVLNQAVRRHARRFPEDFMFQLTKDELEYWRSQFVTSNPAGKMGLRRQPRVFTEQGIAMLASVGYPRKAGHFGVGHVLYGTKFKHEFSHPAEDRPTWDIGPKAA